MIARWSSLLRLSGASDYRLVAWLFLRALGLIYLAAFASLAVQIDALAGIQGIYPIAEQLARAAAHHGGLRFLAYPSLFWIHSGDWALATAAWGGCALALLLTLWPWFGGAGDRGWVERSLLILLYLLYLSLYHAGQIFTNFQWDYLLLEAGFLAVLLPGGPRLTVWLFRWLLFRLRFESGLSKVLSGDTGWRDLTALRHYFETQPLPHTGAWFAHQLPDWLLRLGTGGTLFVELVVPFFIFLPRPWRLFAAWVTILWQLLIIATSNHNFFNLLTICLCLFLFDDRALGPWVPAAWRKRAAASPLLPQQPSQRLGALVLVLTLILVPASLVSGAAMVLGRSIAHLGNWVEWVDRFRLANRYHVFPTVRTERIELQIEASTDGVTWEPLDFRYRPDDPAERPAFIVPHQPRLDWMLWFVPTTPPFLDLFDRFLTRLAQGSPPVTALLARPPTGAERPAMLRVRAYRYRFTTPAERAETGDWWLREDLGPFYPLPFLEVSPAQETPEHARSALSSEG
ncbi:MAG: lipase maturation factor family protein [Chromatiaceae bacterium]